MRAQDEPNEEWRSGEALIPVGRRGAPRLRLSIPARLVTLCDTRRCILIDLSRSGAQIGLRHPLRLFEEGILNIAGVDQFGTVTRSDIMEHGGINGLKFETPLRDSDVLAMREYAESFQDDENRALRREVRAWVDGS